MNTILLVEDDKTIVMGLEYSLLQEGYRVLSFFDAASASLALTKEPFDLAILDVSLPDGSGFDLCKQIRQHSTVPVVFLTARDEEVNIVMGLDMGADDYITKPFRVRELLSPVANRIAAREYANQRRGRIASGTDCNQHKTGKGNKAWIGDFSDGFGIQAASDIGDKCRTSAFPARSFWRAFGISRANLSTTTRSRSISNGCVKRSRTTLQTPYSSRPFVV